MSVTAALFGVPTGFEPPVCWQDREIRFDCSANDVACRQGEELLTTLVRGASGGAAGCSG